MPKDINDYRDKHGLIGHMYKEDHSKFDFGDSCADTSRLYFMTFMLARMGLITSEDYKSHRSMFLEASSRLEISPGTFVRHPDQYNDPKDYSRDQQTALQLAFALCDATEPISRMLKRQIQGFPFFQNADVITYEWIYYIRGLRKWLFYPVLLVLDLGLFVNVLIRFAKAKFKPDDVADDLNLACSLIYCSIEYPTPISLLSRWLYKFKPLGAFYPWSHYYRHPENPPIDDVAYQVIRSYLWR